MIRMNLCGATPGEMLDEFGASGLSIDHARKILISIYRKHIFSVSDIDAIPRKVKLMLSPQTENGIIPPYGSQHSQDGTIKYLYISKDGRKYETVYIPEEKRHTVCVSSQSGCRMGCPFCVTGNYGFHGNLTAGEIVNQVVSIPESQKITHVVFMGMGEPMDNIDNVLKACKILTSDWGLAISPKNITVSSVGITEGIDRFLRESRCNLAFSLFSPFFKERTRMVPAEKKNPADGIINLMKQYPVAKGRRLSLSYVMIDGVNDTDAHLNGLVSLLEGSQLRINLLPYHKVEGSVFASSDSEKIQYFKHNLITRGISASTRKSRGSDISAACGLLASGLRDQL